ncbi:nickel-type superoxide dismutase maturation protease [Myxosarcina sp. GI1]|uniref:nickel-type superoxide dismutase maturation protease n=1 Tax=Myxosarcina sp. GI1 TaxID=1541065 RepID=UPI00056207BB|nr:nickel-type superoxide dismutase maturation protease [Myxosarcina sp. GI1]
MKTLPTSNFRELLLWLLRRRKRFRVTGNSMQPLLQPGEEILIDRHAYQNRVPQIGDIVVATHPFRSGLTVVKRIALVMEDGSLFLKGDNFTESTDSRTFGTVNLKYILGKVTSRFE